MSTASSRKEKTEHQIVQLMQMGDRRFLDLIYTEYSGILFKITLGIVRSREVAEDVLQDSLVKIWKNSESYNPDKAALLTWIVQITKNTALDFVRSKAAKKAHVTDTMEQEKSINSYGISQIKEEFIGLKELLEESLEERDQSILNMLYFEGYTQKEVAEKLDMPLGSVKTRIRLTVNRLRTYFNN
ncbi:RNA polymerase sigma factor [bacterium]|nr:RNA polymerase sigma factor [bacterium]